jgi:NADPH:quinone reductase-like Zn-dependent oxidoreductase
MKVILLSEPGEAPNLVYTDIPRPVAGNGEVLVRVKAISINPVDAKTRAGKGLYGRLKQLSPLILGWDLAGVVEETGPGVTRFREGDEVFGMVNFPGHGQAYAAYVAAPESHLAHKPANISFEHAAASTLAALTAWQAFTRHGKLLAGQRVLIHAAAGGVGHFAVQIARYLGAHVIGTSSAENKDFVLALGAHEHVDYRSAPFEEAVQEVDFVLDTIGGDSIDRSLKVVRTGGTLISIPSGLNEHVTAKAKEKGVNGFFFLVDSNGQEMEQLAHLLETGIIRPFVSKIYQFSEMQEAHRQQESGRTKGKIVIVAD